MTQMSQRIDTAVAWAQVEAQHAQRKRLADEVRPQNKAAILTVNRPGIAGGPNS